MSIEIPQNLIRQKLIEFIHTDPGKGLNVFVLTGTVGVKAKIDAVAGYFPQVTGVALPVFGITTDEPEDKPFGYIPWLNRLTVPQDYLNYNIDNQSDKSRYTKEFVRNGLPIIAVAFGRERDGIGNVTDKQTVLLYAVRGYPPQQALQDIQDITGSYTGKGY
jgi:hypothetical protein